MIAPPSDSSSTATLLATIDSFAGENVAGDFDAIREVLFGENAADVVFDGACADGEFGGDFLVAQTARDRFGDAVFGVGQFFIGDEFFFWLCLIVADETRDAGVCALDAV